MDSFAENPFSFSHFYDWKETFLALTEMTDADVKSFLKI